MVKEIVRDAFFLNQRSDKATKVDLPIAQDQGRLSGQKVSETYAEFWRSDSTDNPARM